MRYIYLFLVAALSCGASQIDSNFRTIESNFAAIATSLSNLNASLASGTNGLTSATLTNTSAWAFSGNVGVSSNLFVPFIYGTNRQAGWGEVHFGSNSIDYRMSLTGYGWLDIQSPSYASLTSTNIFFASPTWAAKVGVNTLAPVAAMHIAAGGGAGGGLKVEGTNQVMGNAYFGSSIFLNDTNLNDHIAAIATASGGVPLRGDGTNTAVNLVNGTNEVSLMPTQTVTSITAASITVTNITDSLGNTGTVAQLLTQTATGKPVWSNQAPAIVYPSTVLGYSSLGAVDALVGRDKTESTNRWIVLGADFDITSGVLSVNNFTQDDPEYNPPLSVQTNDVPIGSFGTFEFFDTDTINWYMTNLSVTNYNLWIRANVSTNVVTNNQPSVSFGSATVTGSVTAASFTGSGSNLTDLPSAFIAIKTNYWIDSVNGSDSNAGTNVATAFQTISKLHSVAGLSISSSVLHFARNSQWREQLTLGSDNELDAYGSGAAPIFNASDIVTNWTPVGGFSSVYAVSNYTVTGGGSDSLISCMEDGVQLIYTNSIAGVEALAGTFFTVGDSPQGSETNIIYINPSRGGNPFTNGGVYELSKRDYGIVGGDRNTIKNIEARNSLSGSGPVKVLLDSYLSGLRIFNGGKHNLYISSGLVEDSQILWGQFSSANSAVVHHSVTDGLRITYRRVTAGGTKEHPYKGSAWTGHTSSARSFDYVQFEDCIGQYANAWGSDGVGTNGLAIHNRTVAYKVYSSGLALYGATNVILGSQIIQSDDASPSFYGLRCFTTGARTWVAGTTIIAPFAVTTDSSSSNHSLTILNSWLASPTAGGNSGVYVIGMSNQVSISNVVVSGFVNNYNLTASNRLMAAGSNVMDGAAFIIDGTNYATFGAFTNGTGLDVTSLTNALQLAGQPSQGNFTFSYTSPIVTNQAGPSWVIPPSMNGIDVVGRLPQRAVFGSWIDGQFLAATNLLTRTKLEATNGISYGLRISGALTNTASTQMYLDGVNNAKIWSNKASSNNVSSFVLSVAGTEKAAFSLPIAGNGLVKLTSESSGPLEINSGNYSLTTKGVTTTIADNAGNAKIMVLQNGNVGIGTNAPDATLHVFTTGTNVLRIDTASVAWPTTTNRIEFIPASYNGTNGLIPFIVP